MATNTITNLIPDLYTALDVVSRELVGLIPAVTSDMTFERAAVGQTVRSPVAPASTASDIAPAVTPPDDGEQTIGNVSMTITKARRVPVRWNGEQSLGLNNNGPTRKRIMVDQFTQAMRTLCNEVEVDLAALHIAASRAYGTAAHHAVRHRWRLHGCRECAEDPEGQRRSDRRRHVARHRHECWCQAARPAVAL
jgi:hypothetical protein